MSKIINKLTPEQEAKIPEYRAEWLKIGLSTDKYDPAAAEDAVQEAYRCADLAPPGIIIHEGSPMAGAIASVLLQKLADISEQGDKKDRE